MAYDGDNKNEWKRKLLSSKSWVLGLAVFGLTILKIFQSNYNSVMIFINFLIMSLLFLFSFKSQKVDRHLDKLTLGLLLLIVIEGFATLIFYPQYFLEKMYWLLVFPVLAIFLVGIQWGAIFTIGVFLGLASQLLKYGKLPDEVLQLGGLNQTLALLILLFLLYEISDVLQKHYSGLRKAIQKDVSDFYKRIYHKVISQQVETLTEMMRNLRHEINNPSAIASLSLQVLKKEGNSSEKVIELEKVLQSIKDRLVLAPEFLNDLQNRNVSQEIETELDTLNQIIEEDWKFRFMFLGQLISGSAALVIATYAVLTFGPDWFRLINAVTFGVFSLGSAWITYRSKDPSRSVVIFMIAVYSQLVIPIFSNGGIFSNGVIWLSVAPFYFHLGLGTKLTSKVKWVSVVALTVLYLFGSSDHIYVSNPIMRIVNFAFSMGMVTGFSIFFELKRRVMVRSNSNFHEQMKKNESTFISSSHQKALETYIVDLKSGLNPLLRQALELSKQIKTSSDSKVSIKIESSIERMCRFNERVSFELHDQKSAF